MNEIRGELKIKLGGKEYILVPEFRVLAAIESRTGGVFSIANRMAKSEFRISDLAAVIYECLVVMGVKEFTYEALGNQILKEGMMKFVPTVSEYCTKAMSGQDESEEVDPKKE